MVATGKMDKRVSIQKYVKTRGTQGGFILGFVTENTVWAFVNPLSAGERVDAEQVKNIRTHRVTMNFYSPGISGKDRLLFGARIFNIVSVVNPGERGCFTILDVKESEVV